jgi:hypothetical protein
MKITININIIKSKCHHNKKILNNHHRIIKMIMRMKMKIIVKYFIMKENKKNKILIKN